MITPQDPYNADFSCIKLPYGRQNIISVSHMILDSTPLFLFKFPTQYQVLEVHEMEPIENAASWPDLNVLWKHSDWVKVEDG